MHSSDSRRGRQDRESSRDRDRKRKHEKDPKEEKRDKHEKHAKRDGHDERGSGDHRKRGDHRDGYGYGEEQRRKEPRGNDGRDGDRGSDRSRADRQGEGRPRAGSDGQNAERKSNSKIVEVQDTIPPIEEKVVDVEMPASKASANKKDWREDMGDEDERDLSDDEETTARKLVESRKRREAMMAKFVTTETPEEKADDAPEGDDSQAVAKASPDAKDDDSGSDAGVVEKREKGEGDREKDKEVTQFILDQKKVKEKASQGGMFDDSEAAAADLNTSVRQSVSAISTTGASGDDWDDQDGYYLAKIGEVMDDRYLVVENACGKGVFSTVIKCKDQKGGDGLVAIKVMRANDMMKKAAEKEIEILGILNNADRGNKRHVIRMMRTFYYRKHLCLVFECMWDDLRKALKKYTQGKGMALQAIRAYTKQLMVGLRHMHKCGIIHADIKPDNILISEGHNVVKFCDLGTALELKDVAISPYLVSRFYRAPEIILGCEYNIACDVFALGATIFECFTGKILFNSKSNNDALRKIMEVKGKIPKNIIKKGMLWKTHFDDNLDFKFEDVDKYTKDSVTRVMTDLKATKDIFDMLVDRVGREKLNSSEREDMQTIKRIKQLADLLNQMLAIDPEKRITANDALSHPFLEDRLGKGVEDAKHAAARR